MKHYAWPVLFGIAVLLFWQAVVVLFDVSRILLPAPSEIFAALVADPAACLPTSTRPSCIRP